MDRRAVLTATLAVLSGTLAGCLGNPGDGGDPNDGSGDPDMTDPSEASGDGGGTETEGEPTPISEFEVLDTAAGGTDDVSITVDDRVVTVAGTIVGSNSCYTARLGAVAFEDRTLVVRVESYEDAPDDVDCRPVETGIGYEATVETGDRPVSVRVEHDGRPVATATPE